MRLDTLTILHPTRGTCIINASDFDPAIHELAKPTSATPSEGGDGKDPEGGQEFTREAIDKAPREELLEILEAHGVNPETVKHMNVSKLRRLTISTLFVDL